MPDPDPTWRACVEHVRKRLGDEATVEQILWSTAFAYLIAVGALSDSCISVALH